MSEEQSYCERLRSDQSEKISGFAKHLVKEGVLEDFGLLEGVCNLEWGFEGTVDLSDVCKEPAECLSFPSIGWKCSTRECSIEADLPVSPEKEKDLVDYVNAIPKCGVSEVHLWPGTEKIPRERHVHIVCKGIHPLRLADRVNQLTRETLKLRSHIVT